MNQVPFLKSRFIRYFDSILYFERYFPTSNESNIKLWMIKPQQTLNIKTKY